MKLKKLFVLLLAPGLLNFLPGCSVAEKISNLDNFTITMADTTEVQGSTILQNLLGNLGFEGFSKFDVESSQELQNQGVKKNQIEYAKLNRFTLKITDPSDVDFTFLDSIKFFVSEQNLPKILVGQAGDFLEGTTEINLQLPDVDLKAYITAPFMEITSEVKGKLPSKTTTIEATIKLFIEADVSGSITG